MHRLIAVAIAFLCALPALAAPLPAGLDPQNTIFLDTAYGRVIIRLRAELAPKHAERIKTLTREKFYDNAPFHRVIPGFMAQTFCAWKSRPTPSKTSSDLPATRQAAGRFHVKHRGGHDARSREHIDTGHVAR